jgi:hypothetical protein
VVVGVVADVAERVEPENKRELCLLASARGSSDGLGRFASHDRRQLPTPMS